MRPNKLQLTLYIFLTIVFFGSIYIKANENEFTDSKSEVQQSSMQISKD